MPIEFLTPKEIKRRERNAAICNEYERLTALDGAVSVNRKINYIASNPVFGVKVGAVRKVLQNAGKI